jgi:hypothetical protein
VYDRRWRRKGVPIRLAKQAPEAQQLMARALLELDVGGKISMPRLP